MPGGIGRFIPYDIGANHCRLRPFGREKCGHGLTSRPGESASEGFLDELLLLFRYPPRSAAALLEGTLPLRCETAAGDFLNELLVLFRYPPRSAAALQDGKLYGEVCWQGPYLAPSC